MRACAKVGLARMMIRQAYCLLIQAACDKAARVADEAAPGRDKLARPGQQERGSSESVFDCTRQNSQMLTCADLVYVRSGKKFCLALQAGAR